MQSYSADAFRKDAQQMLELIAAELENVQTEKNIKTIDRKSPQEQLAFWQQELAAPTACSLSELTQKIMQRSIRFHSKGYLGHQVAVTLPLTALTSALIGYLNNCTTVYELGMAGNAMEKVVVAHLAEKYGYGQRATGFITSGGSMGNLTALVTARTSSGVDERDYGRLAVMVSEEAHYSVERAAKIMGLPSDGIIKIPTGADFAMRTDLLESYYEKAAAAGKIVFCVVGCACTTSVGAHDNLEKLADFAEKHNIWFHVDGAHGGAAIFSDKYKYLLKGIDRSDSLIVDFHKMLLTPPLSTALLYNSGHRKINEFSPQAAYLWQDQLSEEWWNSAKHTLECTKPLTVIHTYAIMRLYGDKLYQQNVDTLYDLGRQFAALIKEQEDMELALEPSSNIVCFRFIPAKGDIDEVNRQIAGELLRDGTYYSVSTSVRGKFYLRVTLMNPLTGIAELQGFLQKIREAAKGL
ncbi:aminotransferase class I/II-fold pyridoxal phosphate-dependent enzyme [uncultured Phascolarctobacterium sp.]|uniref:pyridoxal phosphate-dependent decarboxylase family protein n=1 Tax=uncultured Phascolarctobacterium sp. TaxID=512296 RepID=UPI0025D82B39|nr:aminotransferase class I/II-fold pyridoxal phosphate-dependent enzyme [uncultured Phascolarctobacterium sp.]